MKTIKKLSYELSAYGDTEAYNLKIERTGIIEEGEIVDDKLVKVAPISNGKKYSGKLKNITTDDSGVIVDITVVGTHGSCSLKMEADGKEITKGDEPTCSIGNGSDSCSLPSKVKYK